MRLRLALSLSLGLLVASAASAQPWESYPAFRDVRAVAASGDAMWAATPAGVFGYALDGGAFERYTTIDGLQGGDARAITVDASGRVWIGYGDGVLDRIDPASGEVRSFFDIERADQFASRGVNRLRARGDSLLIATDFGLVIWDLTQDQVRQTASRLGPLDPATPVQDVLVAPDPGDGSPTFWLATDGGIVRAPLATPNLQIASAWTRDEGFTASAYALAYYEDVVWASGRLDGASGDLYRRGDDGVWGRRIFFDGVISELIVGDGILAAVERDGGRLFLFETFFQTRNFDARPSALRFQSVTFGADGRFWGGDSGVGLFQFPAVPDIFSGEIPFEPAPLLPSGPFSNDFTDLDLSPDGDVWLVTATAPVGVSGAAGVSRLRDGEWQTVRTDTSPLPQSSFESVVARPDGGALAGTAGLGLAVIEDDLSVSVFDASNSTLRSATGQSNFIVISDMVREGDLWWVVNKSSPLPLHVFPGTPEATLTDWSGFPSPPGGPSGVGADRIALDEFGQKWLALGDQGLMVWDTGTDPRSASDDRGRTFGVGFNGQGLPNGTVTSLILDREGRMWIGTRRGIAIVFSPGSAFGGDAALAEPVWPVTGEGDGTDYLLRDANVNDLAIDPAGRIWVATSSGAFLLTPGGDAIELQLTASDTPLPSDQVLDVGVDQRTGIVYLTTDAGLYSYQGDATGPDLASEELRVGPSPFRPREHDAVIISGLNAPASRVRVLTIDGRVVFESDAIFGGSFRWDGRDTRTGDLVPSGVYLVAASGAEGESTIYGKLAVIQ